MSENSQSPSLQPDAAPANEEAPPRRERRDRKATEQTILKAFESVLLREGVQGLGVNAVANEAGVNKVLIYRYFQDFPGLARQWASSSSFWPSELELIGNDPDGFENLEVPERIIEVLKNYMTAIRSRPRTVEMMTGDMLGSNDTTRALVDGMARPGRGVSDYIKLDEAKDDIDDKVFNLIFLVNIVTAFAAIRERNNPHFLGFDMTQDESWDFLRNTIAEIAASYLKD